MHKRLIENYRTYCKGDFAELPKNDNYIFLYFGYHLKHAEMFEEFPLWFMNLKFLESKISVTGPADLLADLQKYRKYIAVKVKIVCKTKLLPFHGYNNKLLFTSVSIYF